MTEQDEQGALERRLEGWADGFLAGGLGYKPELAADLQRAAEALGEYRRAMRRVHDELAAGAVDIVKAYQPSLPMWLAARANGLRDVLVKLEANGP